MGLPLLGTSNPHVYIIELIILTKAYYVPGTVLNILCVLSNSILTVTLLCKALLPSFHRWGNWGTEGPGNFFKVRNLVRIGARIKSLPAGCRTRIPNHYPAWSVEEEAAMTALGFPVVVTQDICLCVKRGLLTTSPCGLGFSVEAQRKITKLLGAVKSLTWCHMATWRHLSCHWAESWQQVNKGTQRQSCSRRGLNQGP